MKRSILLLHVILALALVVSCEPPKLQPNIKEYVEQLGHDDWATRDQATKKLIELCNSGYKEQVVDALSKRLTRLDTRDKDRLEVWLRAMQILNHEDVKAEPILVPEKAKLAGSEERLKKINTLISDLGSEEQWERKRASLALIELGRFLEEARGKSSVIEELNCELRKTGSETTWSEGKEVLEKLGGELILVPNKAELAANASELEEKIDSLVISLGSKKECDQERASLSLIELGLYRGSRDKVLDRLRDAAKNKNKPKIQGKAKQVFNAVLVRGVNRGLGPALKLTVKGPVSGKIDIVVENGPLGGPCKLISGSSGSGEWFRGTALQVGDTRTPVDRSFDDNGKVELKGIPWPGSAGDYYIQAIAAEDHRFESFILSNGVKVSMPGTDGRPVEKTVEVEVPVEAPVEED